MKKFFVFTFIFGLLFNIFALESYIDIDMIRQPQSPRFLNEGFLFTLPEDTGYSIFLRMNADNWQKDYHFHKNLFNVWCLYVPYTDISDRSKSTTMLYKLNINGFWDNDPSNENFIYDRFHEKISYLRLPSNQNNCKKVMPIISNSDNPAKKNVIFKYYNPKAKNVSIVCSDSNWSIFSQNMSLDQYGYWEVNLDFGKGTFYYYFLSDWEKVLDMQNPDYEYDSQLGEVNKFVVK